MHTHISVIGKKECYHLLYHVPSTSTFFQREEKMSAQRAREAKELITDLGPAFVKIEFEASNQKEFAELIAKCDLAPGLRTGADSELQSIAKKYGSFQLPGRDFRDPSLDVSYAAMPPLRQGYATLIIRALATLEGVGLKASSSFSLKYLGRKAGALSFGHGWCYTMLHVLIVAPRPLRKGDRAEAAAAGAPTPETVTANEVNDEGLDLATRAWRC
eukprot:Skav233131  [mRNA]  locus=scaffold792:160331:167624:+ [translate_table: standard]